MRRVAVLGLRKVRIGFGTRSPPGRSGPRLARSMCPAGALVTDHGAALRAHLFVGASGQGPRRLQPRGAAHTRVATKPVGSAPSRRHKLAATSAARPREALGAWVSNRLHVQILLSGAGGRRVDYLAGHRGPNPGALFRSRQGHAVRPNALNVLMRRVAVRVGLRKVHPHRFRHTFATWAIRSQAREIDVQILLGHSSLTMVQRYARTYSSEQAVKAHAGFSPVGQLTRA